MPETEPRIALIAPRNMRFSPTNATSIDLYIHEIARMSRYRKTITVFAQKMEHPFDDVAVEFWESTEDFDSWSARLAGTRPDCIVVHQHLPTAAKLARSFRSLPVALVRHNFIKPPRNLFSAWHKRRQMAHLAGLAFVSECCRSVFHAEWRGGIGGALPPDFVTPNGIDTAAWRPGAKERVILFVGRLAPEKGVLEAAQALGQVLAREPAWRGRFILDSKAAEPGYNARVRAALEAPCHSGRLEVLENLPHDAVRRFMAEASIALAPTQNAEPFGRVAIEALASGAALVASRAGGFIEITGEAGILLETPSAENIAHALDRLIGDPALIARLGADGPRRIAGRYDLASAAAAFDTMAEALTGRGAAAPAQAGE